MKSMPPADYDILIDPPTEALDLIALGIYQYSRSILEEAGHGVQVRYALAAHPSTG
jgi:hypothetical protein